MLDTLYSRQDFEIEYLGYDIQEDQARGFVAARLHYWNGSLLDFDKTIIVEQGLVLNKISYAYHYQGAGGTLILRYDTTPHHPEIASTFPHHKHIGETIESSAAPDLHEVLQEIDRVINSKSAPG